MRHKLAAGNWKMNGLACDLTEVSDLLGRLDEFGCEVLICPPATLLQRMADVAAGSTLRIGGQDCHAVASGAFTGDISAAMLRDAGASHVILGHSERREFYAESDDLVRAKAVAVRSQGLIAVICIGETLAERDAGAALDVVGAQLAGSVPDNATGADVVVAYEPVWAIGTGRTPTLEQIAEVHDFLRAELEQRFGSAVGGAIRLLYGGSVKPGNAAEIFGVSNVDGALVGGASLKAADFAAIIAALDAA